LIIIFLLDPCGSGRRLFLRRVESNRWRHRFFVIYQRKCKSSARYNFHSPGIQLPSPWLRQRSGSSCDQFLWGWAWLSSHPRLVTYEAWV